ncbi:MAG TPA: acetate--CoA ligase [Acidimicrobiales bacterium]|nr:acetate--CoA ligase [Acidimicrobiales bacterium]
MNVEQRETADFWLAAEAALDGLPDGAGLNIAYESVDRHVAHGNGESTALRWLGRRGDRRDFTYEQLRDDTNRFANLLAGLGVAQGERVFVLLGRVPELYVSVLGALKHRAMVCPLFSSFGPEPIQQRVNLGAASVLVTNTAQYSRKVAPIRSQLPTLRCVVLVGEDAPHDPALGVLSWSRLMADASVHYRIGATSAQDPALLHFTSGTTGAPKGVVHVHEAVVAHHATGSHVLDMHPTDIFWCTADPGWVTGTSYGIVSPLTHGVTLIVDEGEFDVDRWYRVLDEQRVNIWYTAPTAIRMLMRAGTDAVRGHDLSALRVIASVGEPLNPEAVIWGRDAYGIDILDNWWQTETGGIMIANRPGSTVKPGSMGIPVPGVQAAILRRDPQGQIALVDGEPVLEAPGVDGELALRAGWPSMFRAYLDMEDRYRKSFIGSWYRTGDLARVDDDGYYWFVGRADDVIKSAGHLIGPFEVESALMEHPAIAEAGVIGIPDAVIGEVVKAFVVLKPGIVDDGILRRDLMAHARRRLGPAIAPREIVVRDDLPRTRSGKIMRRLLKARELGLPEGDLSTLESGQ